MSLFSHSRLSTFERCPLKFRFRYIDKVEASMEQSVEAFLGTLVHATLEKLYKDLRFKKLNTLEELLEWFRAEWRRNWNKNILIVRKGYTQHNYRKMGESYIRDYYRRYKPFDQSRTIALEEKVIINLDPDGRYKMQGVIDRLSYAGDGVYEVHDYKTNFNIPLKQYLEDDRQLALYALSVLHNYQDAKSVKLIWHFLSVDKEYVTEKTPEELEKLKKDTMDLIDSVRSEREFPARPGKLCLWCEFREECPAQKHPSKVEKLPPNKYLKEPGVRLVNKYAELKRKEKDFREKIGEELAQVHEALLKYAEKEGINTVKGSEVQATIWSKDCIKFPGKNDPGREELEGIIRSSGLWKRTSMLDTWELERLVQDGRLSQDVIKKLSKFARKERVERIYLRKPTT